MSAYLTAMMEAPKRDVIEELMRAKAEIARLKSRVAELEIAAELAHMASVLEPSQASPEEVKAIDAALQRPASPIVGIVLPDRERTYKAVMARSEQLRNESNPAPPDGEA